MESCVIKTLVYTVDMDQISNGQIQYILQNEKNKDKSQLQHMFLHL